MTMQPDPANGPWHVDKRIPLALILTIIIQTSAFGYWIGQLSNQLDSAIETNRQQDDRLDSQDAAINGQLVTTATMHAQLAGVRESLSELKAAQAETNRLLRDLAGRGAP